MLISVVCHCSLFDADILTCNFIFDLNFYFSPT